MLIFCNISSINIIVIIMIGQHQCPAPKLAELMRLLFELMRYSDLLFFYYMCIVCVVFIDLSHYNYCYVIRMSLCVMFKY